MIVTDQNSLKGSSPMNDDKVDRRVDDKKGTGKTKMTENKYMNKYIHY